MKIHGTPMWANAVIVDMMVAAHATDAKPRRAVVQPGEARFWNDRMDATTARMNARLLKIATMHDEKARTTTENLAAPSAQGRMACGPGARSRPTAVPGMRSV
jgi:hypothetical protein